MARHATRGAAVTDPGKQWDARQLVHDGSLVVGICLCPYCGVELNVELVDRLANGTPIVRFEHECVYVGGNVVGQGSGNASP